VLGGIAVAGVVTLLAFSCAAGPPFNYNGEWMGNRNLTGPNATLAYTYGRVTVTIKDNKFDATSAGVPVGGKVSFEGDHIVLHTETYFGQPLSHASEEAVKNHPDVTVKPQMDGTILYLDPAAADGKPLVLKRTKLPPDG
jgi:hypothetical protein